MNKILRYGIFLVLYTFSFNCKKADQPVVPEEKFIRFYSDLMIIENQTDTTKQNPVVFKKKIDSLYHSYDLDTTAIRKTIAYYNQDVSRWREFYSKVIKRLQVIAQTDTSQRRMEFLQNKIRR